jgi:hypothetical protein
MTLPKLALIALGSTALTAVGPSVQAFSIYNTLGGAENGGDPLAAVGPVLADWFRSDAGPSVLNSVTLNLRRDAAPNTGFDIVVTRLNASLMPTAIVPIAAVSDSSLTDTFQTYTYTMGTRYTMVPGSFYVIAVADMGGSSAVWGNTVDPTVLARPDVIAGAFYFNTAGGVQANAGGPYELNVDAVNVPEPAAWALTLVGLGGLGVALRAKRRIRVVAA